MLTDLVTTAGVGHVILADATIPEERVRVADTAAEMMGGIDLMVYAAGVGVLQRIEDVDPELWIRLFRCQRHRCGAHDQRVSSSPGTRRCPCAYLGPPPSVT